MAGYISIAIMLVITMITIDKAISFDFVSEDMMSERYDPKFCDNGIHVCNVGTDEDNLSEKCSAQCQLLHKGYAGGECIGEQCCCSETRKTGRGGGLKVATGGDPVKSQLTPNGQTSAGGNRRDDHGHGHGHRGNTAGGLRDGHKTKSPHHGDKNEFGKKPNGPEALQGPPRGEEQPRISGHQLKISDLPSVGGDWW